MQAAMRANMNGGSRNVQCMPQGMSWLFRRYTLSEDEIRQAKLAYVDRIFPPYQDLTEPDCLVPVWHEAGKVDHVR